MFQKLRNTTSKNKRVSTFDEKEVFGVSKIRNASLKENGVTPGFKAKTKCSSYVCPGTICHTNDQNHNISE
jgi:hypothetical protein